MTGITTPIRFRVVETDRFGGDYPDESWACEPCSQEEAKAKVEELNQQSGAYADGPRYFKVVREDYELVPGFEP